MNIFNIFKKKPEVKRNFDGAKGSRYTSDWLANEGPADKFLRSDIDSLRSRARDLERNDGYAESILAEIESNVIGQSGIMLKPMARKADARNKGGIANKLDSDACEKIAHWWSDYSKKGNFDVTRQYSRAGFERQTIRSVARDGGFLVRMLDGIAKSKHGFMVQGIETDFLDPKYSDPGKRISMSVEFDEWDEPIRYHLRKGDPKSWQWKEYETIPVDASDMLNLFFARRISQSQGFSWLAPIMVRLRHLSKFEEAEVISARIGANKHGYFKQSGEQQYTGDEDELGNIVAPQTPGEWEVLPHGIDPVFIDPSHPNANYPDFRKAILRGVCAGVIVNYNTVARDLEGVSYSSIRQGVLSERDTWRVIQAWFIDSFEVPVYERALRMALITGQIEGLSILDFERVCHAEFSGRTWAWVDPLKDVEAAAAEITLGINSRQNVCRERGKDFAKVLGENEDDVAALESAGLPTDPKGNPAPVAAPAPVEVED